MHTRHSVFRGSSALSRCHGVHRHQPPVVGLFSPRAPRLHRGLPHRKTWRRVCQSARALGTKRGSWGRTSAVKVPAAGFRGDFPPGECMAGPSSLCLPVGWGTGDRQGQGHRASAVITGHLGRLPPNSPLTLLLPAPQEAVTGPAGKQGSFNQYGWAGSGTPGPGGQLTRTGDGRRRLVP